MHLSIVFLLHCQEAWHLLILLLAASLLTIPCACFAGSLSDKGIAQAAGSRHLTQPSAADSKVAPAQHSNLDTASFGSWATDPTLIPGAVSSSSNADGSTIYPFVASQSARTASGHMPTGPLGTTGIANGGLPNGSHTAGRDLAKIDVPDLSFMLSDTVVLPQ